MTADPSEDRPIGKPGRKPGPFDWSKSSVPDHRCTAHKKNGEQCNNPAIRGGRVCGFHGGNAPAVKAKARLRLEMASDRLARELLNMTTDPNVADPVKLSAIKDALDRGGIQAKTAVSVEVSTKPFELVFDSIAAGPRVPAPPALAELPASESESEDDEIVGEIDEDPEDEFDDYPSGFVPDSESSADHDDVVDVEVVVDTGYTDDPGTATSDDSDSSLSVDLSGLMPGPLGPNGPAGSGLMTLEDAVEAQHEMNRRAAARTRNMRRR